MGRYRNPLDEFLGAFIVLGAFFTIFWLLFYTSKWAVYTYILGR